MGGYEMLELEQLQTDICAAIAVDCLNTFMKVDGKLSIAAYQQAVHSRDIREVQSEIDEVAMRMGSLRKCLFEAGIPQIQFQDAHVVEWIHGKRYHSREIARLDEEPDNVRSFAPHALLDANRRVGTPDQQAIEEISLATSDKILISWLDKALPQRAEVAPHKELIFWKDDFCMSPGSPFVDRLFWELRRQSRFNLIVFGVCDEICNLRNVMLMLASIFNVIYVQDCTYPLDPHQREHAIRYMKKFNRLGQGLSGQFLATDSQDVISHFSRV
jgi:nicotinamidase-related amidase